MTRQDDAIDGAVGAGRLREALRDHSGFAVERMAGLGRALDLFVIEAKRKLAPFLNGEADGGAAGPARSITLFQAIGECVGLTAAIYVSKEPEARLLIALDERIDDLIVATVFGDSLPPESPGKRQDGERRRRTAIETALIEEFARTLGGALEAAFAPVAPLSVVFESLMTLSDVTALGRRDMPGAAAPFSLPMGGASCECLILMPQPLLLPFRKELEREEAEPARPDRLWSLSMETEMKQTRLPVAAILEELSMTLGDVARFRVGEVLPLQTAGFEALRLECAGRSMFLCKLGQGGGKYRLEIDLPIAQDHGPSME